MLGPSIRQSFRPNGLLFQIIVGSGFGLLLDTAFPRLSPLLVLGALTAAVFMAATLRRPEVLQLNGDGVHVTGRVDDVIRYYRHSAVCVVPLRAGGGTRLKILGNGAWPSRRVDGHRV